MNWRNSGGYVDSSHVVFIRWLPHYRTIALAPLKSGASAEVITQETRSRCISRCGAGPECGGAAGRDAPTRMG